MPALPFPGCREDRAGLLKGRNLTCSSSFLRVKRGLFYSSLCWKLDPLFNGESSDFALHQNKKLQNAGMLWEKHFSRTALVGFVLIEPCKCRTGEVLVEPFASGQCCTNGVAHSSHTKCFFGIFRWENIHRGGCSFISVLFMVQEALGWTSPWLQMTSNQGLTWSVRKSSPME